MEANSATIRSKAGGWVVGLEKMEAIWLHICEARPAIEALPVSMVKESGQVNKYVVLSGRSKQNPAIKFHRKN
ncbi:hypothetical protein V6N12_043300 [Hibiscus sabdariffa]|uniref:Uncharacterized protein n=1 Tax=Hibiscus sabdariffa TaxID=183260 RepID=A0ABR2DDX2_9ROSI